MCVCDKDTVLESCDEEFGAQLVALSLNEGIRTGCSEKDDLAKFSDYFPLYRCSRLSAALQSFKSFCVLTLGLLP